MPKKTIRIVVNISVKDLREQTSVVTTSDSSAIDRIYNDYPLHDHNDHLVFVLDSTGKTVEAYRYSAFFWRRGDLQFAYSQGAALCTNALLDYPPELRNRIIVVAIAPSEYIYEETCAKLTHYRVSASRDFVPRLDRAGAERVAHTIVELQSVAGASLHDHNIKSPTYAPRIFEAGQEYLKSVKQ